MEISPASDIDFIDYVRFDTQDELVAFSQYGHSGGRKSVVELRPPTVEDFPVVISAGHHTLRSIAENLGIAGTNPEYADNFETPSFLNILSTQIKERLEEIEEFRALD